MKLISRFWVSLVLLLIMSCSKARDNNFIIPLKHYHSEIEINLPKKFDTLYSWEDYSDNIMDAKRGFRVQNSKLPLFKTGHNWDKNLDPLFCQMTITEPLNPENLLYEFVVNDWLKNRKEIIIEERPNYHKLIIDSIKTNNKVYGMIYIERKYADEFDIEVIYATNVNNQILEINFHTNLPNSENFYQESLEAIQSISFKNQK